MLPECPVSRLAVVSTSTIQRPPCGHDCPYAQQYDRRRYQLHPDPPVIHILKQHQIPGAAPATFPETPASQFTRSRAWPLEGAT